MTLVLDSSATLAWVLAEEVTPALVAVFDRVAATHALVPSLWRLEVANALTMGVRRGRIAVGERDATLSDLALLDIRTDNETEAQAWGGTLRFADRFGLSLYDAAYLELAQRRALPLATLDAALARAASASGVAVLGG